MPDFMPDDVYSKLFDFYLAELAGSLGRVLKTDCWNEAKALPAPGGVLPLLDGWPLLAIDNVPAIVAEARTRVRDGVVFGVGDIRALAFPKWSFDTILDLSTLDHIPWPDVPAALGEYWRALRPRGRLYLGVWCAEDVLDEPIDGLSLRQYTFPEQELLAAVAAAGFTTRHKHVYWTGREKRFVRLNLRKRGHA